MWELLPVLAIDLGLGKSIDLGLGKSCSDSFQRSGAIVIICGLIAETFAVKIMNTIKPSGGNFIDPNQVEAIRIYIKLPNKMSQIVLILIGIGTIIWAYGDMILNFVLNSCRVT